MSDARRFFDAIAPRYDRDYALGGALSRARTADVLRRIAGKSKVLVLGIGTGRELPLLLDAGHDVVGLDVSPAMLAAYDRRSRKAPVVLGDFFAPLPFPTATFDAVLALHGTLAHPPHDHALADLAHEIVRVTRPDGVFVAEVPAAHGLGRIGAAEDRFAVTGPTTFVHRDPNAMVELEGVALDAGGWRAALAPLVVEALPLGEVEFLLVGTPPAPSPVTRT